MKLSSVIKRVPYIYWQLIGLKQRSDKS